MDRYYTFMLIPEKDKNIISFRLPRFFVHSLSFILVVTIFVVGILIYDYKQILNQVYENKQLALQNQKLKDQLNIFQMKLNALTQDINRIHIFEKKLRTITGVDQSEAFQQKAQESLSPELTLKSEENDSPLTTLTTPLQEEALALQIPLGEEELQDNSEYLQLKSLYEEQLLQDLGATPEGLTQGWPLLSGQSGYFSTQFALFDFKQKKLQSTLEKLEVSFHALDEYLLDQESFLRSTPTLLPTRGWVTSYFGVRPSPYSGRLKIHEGLDIGAQRDTPIVAPADGVITYAGQKPGFGKFVQIDHGYGLETVFGHCDRLVTTYGSKVDRGDLIATVGNTGLSTGPHLHYEIRVNGVAVDPLYFILD